MNIGNVNTHIVDDLKFNCDSLIEKVEKCLNDDYQIDENSAKVITTKLSPLFKTSEGKSVLTDFVKKSSELNIQFIQSFKEVTLSLDDAVLVAPKWHEVLFESHSVRVLNLDSQPGDEEPYHTHSWKSLLVITKSAEFLIINNEGMEERDVWPIGVYELPAESSPSAYFNVGSTNFNALRFEIKG